MVIGLVVGVLCGAAYLLGGVAAALIGVVPAVVLAIFAPEIAASVRTDSMSNAPKLRATSVVSLLTSAVIAAFVTVQNAESYDHHLVRMRDGSLSIEEGEQGIEGLADVGNQIYAVGWSRPADDGLTSGALWFSRTGKLWTRHGLGNFDRAIAAPSEGTWRTFADLVAHKRILLVVGTDGGDAAVWRWDGAAWQRVPDPEASFTGPGNQTFDAVAYGQGRWLAVGTDDRVSATPVVWQSTDGWSWSRQVALGGDLTEFRALAYCDGVWVAAGTDAATDPLIDTQPGYAWAIDAVIWTSDDGLKWERVKHDTDLFGGAGAQGIRGVGCAGGDWVAVGIDDLDDAGMMDAAIWLSDDAVHWRRFESAVLSGNDGWQEMTAVMPIGEDWVIGGTDSPPSPLGMPFDQSAAVWALRSERAHAIDLPFSDQILRLE